MKALFASFLLLALCATTSSAQITTSTNRVKIIGADGSLTLDYTGTGDSTLTLSGPAQVAGGSGGDADNAFALGGIPASQWVKYASFTGSGNGALTVATMPVTPGVYEVDLSIMACYPATSWTFSVSAGTVSWNGIFRNTSGDATEVSTAAVGVLNTPASLKAYVTVDASGTLNLVHNTGYGYRGHVTFRRMQ